MPCGFDAGALRQIVRIGLPLGLNSALYSIGHVFLQVLYNLQGSVFVAGCSVAGKVGGLANITVTSLSQATSVFAGQNLGAQSYSRLRRGGRLLPAASGLLSLAGGLLMAACCRPLLLLFTQDEAVLAFAVRYIRVVLPFQWCYAAFNAIMSFANGMGEIRYSTIVNIILLWGVRIPASYLLAWLGYGGYSALLSGCWRCCSTINPTHGRTSAPAPKHRRPHNEVSCPTAKPAQRIYRHPVLVFERRADR